MVCIFYALPFFMFFFFLLTTIKFSVTLLLGKVEFLRNPDMEVAVIYCKLIAIVQTPSINVIDIVTNQQEGGANMSM